jgi:Uma2 family endonuclease
MGTAARFAPHDPYALVQAVAHALPDGYRVEYIDGVIHALPRPKRPHIRASNRLFSRLRKFHDPEDPDDPGGWVISEEEELHFGQCVPRIDVAVPDLAGWKIARVGGTDLPTCETHGYTNLAPDWICEVLSPDTEERDRGSKMDLWAREAVTHVWLVDPLEKTLEIFRRTGIGYGVVARYAGSATVRAEPFDAVPLDLSALWSY